MKRTSAGKRPRRCGAPPSAAQTDAGSIDARYGLEPVIDIGSSANPGGADGIQFQTIQCPYCGERFEVQLDTSSGSSRYVEDCQVCCQPIDFCLEVDHAGVLKTLSTLRSD